jgi:hypothetical protein
MEITRAELVWLLKFIDNYDNVLEAYPELFTKYDIDDIKIVRQIIEEKLA